MTAADRLLATGTTVCAAVLAVLVAMNWEAFDAAPPRVLSPTALAAASTADEPAPAARPAEGAARPRPGAAIAAARPARRLALRAVNGPTWLEVRAGGPEGKQLYYGFLAPGAEERFEPLPIWVRVGAAERLELFLDSRRVASPPAAPNGVVEFVASADGVAAVEQAP